MLTDLLVSKRRGGHIDVIDDMVIAGWAVDLTHAAAPAALLLLVDDQVVGSFNCTDPRPDLNALGVPGSRLGFRFAIPDAALDSKPHRIRIRFRSGEVLTYGPQDNEEVLYHSTTVHGMVDGITGTAIRGWAFRLDKRSSSRTGGVTLEVRANGVVLGQVKAGELRSDVARAHGCEPHCGFIYTVPPRLRDGHPFELEFHAVPEGVQLTPSPFRGQVLVQDQADRLLEMYGQVEALCTQAYALKDQLRQLVATDEYTLATYHGWAVTYYDTLRARVVALRRDPRHAALLGRSRPTVSIICPVYKPALADFVAAIDSVRRQSWQGWELIIVDDASRSPALTEVIRDACETDTRIRAIPHKKNQGISAATNTGIAAATGEWVALFDHDDLLVDVALEVMLLAARNVGARVLYSDEDKIDQYGYFSEPHLKPDWNYRLLLTNNYVCHLLLVETAVLRTVGPLNSRYDGAQDHDLVLRLSEHLPASAIHHVPELLYHWRKSAGSTASAVSAKPYAAAAGRQAVLDHLRRRDLPAKVEPVHDSTLYDVRWGFRAEPKVSILIPFKDQVDITRRCVNAVLALTTYANYHIVLIDNWSTAVETQAWLSDIARQARVSVIRIEEAFNFSRINNRVAEQLETDFLLFLNNDVIVQQADWLRLMVNEALADAHVGIVGAKLLYPNGAVQHAGVVLGVGGVADHTFRMLPRDAPGYASRAICAQDWSAVTAACMLCRADAFRDAGMFDDTHLAVAFNDVDFCLRLGQAGYRVVMVPTVVAEHHESISRSSDFAPYNVARFYSENQTMMDRWGEVIRSDPYYNPHFSRETGMFDTLSTSSLHAARAPSLLRIPVPRATLPPGTQYLEPVAGTTALPAKHRPASQRARRPRATPGARMSATPIT